jgi:hypothetical protein
MKGSGSAPGRRRSSSSEHEFCSERAESQAFLSEDPRIASRVFSGGEGNEPARAAWVGGLNMS